MGVTGARFVGVELYCDDLKKARSFYAGVLGLQIAEEQEGPRKFDSENGFICLEKKGVESYPSKDKAVLFFEVGGSANVHRYDRERPVGEGRKVVGGSARSRGPQRAPAGDSQMSGSI
jgi:catechol 2,3-dioxygenase-like lactoylglutathione lyase family enzyme